MDGISSTPSISRPAHAIHRPDTIAALSEEGGMITDVASYLRFFDSVRRRTERDIAALPPEAAAWQPPATGGEAGWSIGRIVRHIATSREYFASAYRGEGWIAQLVPDPEGGEH